MKTLNIIEELQENSIRQMSVVSSSLKLQNQKQKRIC